MKFARSADGLRTMEVTLEELLDLCTSAVMSGKTDVAIRTLQEAKSQARQWSANGLNTPQKLTD